MACPMVSAVYALLMELEPEMSAEKLTQVLQKTALDLGEKGKDIYYGDGLIQPLKALRTLKKQNSQEQETEKTENIGDLYQENTAGSPEYSENSDSVTEKTEPETEENVTESIAADSPAIPDKTEIPAEPEENAESEIVSEPESTEETEAQTEDEKAQEEQIDALKNKLDEIQPEEEIKYEIQEEQNDGEEKQKAYRENCCGLMIGAAILIIIIVWIRKRINSKKV